LLKKTITYKDFNDEEVSEDFFFHLSKAELVELEMSHKGGLSEALKLIIASDDGKAIITEFKNILLTSYGIRSEDGRRFIKNQNLRDEFESTEAYSTLFMELVTNADAAIEFINGIIPAGMVSEVEGLGRTETAPTLAAVPPVPEPVVETRVITREEVDAMSQEELISLGADISSGAVKIEDS
jgi:hypothetical protein